MDIADAPEGLETTGRYIVTFKEGAHEEGMAMLAEHAGISPESMMSSLDFGDDGVDMAQVPSDGGVILRNIGVAVVNALPDAAGALSLMASEDSPILAIEPEGVMHAIDEGFSLEYLRGFNAASASLLSAAERANGDGADPEAEAVIVDTAKLTWGLQAIRAAASRYTGQGIKVAILDTGFFLRHPDFVGRTIVGKSFIPGVTSVNDGHGHGTHCTGTACGPLKPPVGRRYGVAHKASIFIGKVLTDGGSGVDAGILAGIDWAIANRCHVISMSLGANTPATTVAYETAGRRALAAGCLIVAAAGNNANRPAGNFGFVGRPANSRSFMAVGAIDSALKIAPFSARDTQQQPGTAVDIAGPGVLVYSSWPMPKRYNTISGTSMATPHVSGVAALLAQKTGLRGAALWTQVVAHFRALPIPSVDVGKGLVQAP